MRTLKYKTLKGLLKATQYGTIGFNDFKKRRMYHSTGWRRFELTDDTEVLKCYTLFAEAICAKKNVEKYAQLMWRYNGPNYGVLNCLLVHYTDERMWGDYIQELVDRRPLIQTIIRNNH